MDRNSRLQKQQDKINRLILVIIICFFLYFIAVLFFSRSYSYGFQHYIPIECKTEALSRLKSRGLSLRTTVEITRIPDRCQYRFEWIDGKWYKL